MAEQLIALYRRDPQNVGDQASSVFSYIPSPVPVDARDIDTFDPDDIDPLATVVVGGGGLLNCTNRWNRAINRVLARPGKTIGWALGDNTHCGTHISVAVNLAGFALLGVRDVGTPWRWVPCPSCLDVRFDARPEIARQIGVFWHRMFPLPSDLRAYDVRFNDCSFVEALEFIGSSETVISNSFHGCYWAALYGRRVVLRGAFSTKFARLPADYFRESRRHGEFVGRCRQANRDFLTSACAMFVRPANVAQSFRPQA